MKQCNWGIIGTGRICDKFCHGLKMLDNANIAAVCSRSQTKGEEFAEKFDIGKIYTSVETLCADESIDIVYIGTPHPMHLEPMLKAIEAGKNVLCEKPMTLNEEQARIACEAAERKGVFLMEAMWTRFLPSTQQALQWVREGKIGEVREVTASYRRDLPEDPKSRLYAPELGGGAMLDLGVYPLFAAQLMLGGGRPEIAYTDVVYSDSGIDKESTTILKYPGGRRAYISVGFDCTACTTVIEGTNGCYITVPNWCYNHSAYMYHEGDLIGSFCEPMENGMQYEAAHVMECLEKGLTQSPDYPLHCTLDELHCCDELRRQWGVHYPAEDENITETAADESVPRIVKLPGDDWYRDAVFYHIYPLGMCGAPQENTFGAPAENRLAAIEKTLPHIESMGFSAVYFGPVFESSGHGYDTADYRLIDRRLGTNEQFAHLCRRMHMRGMRVVVDGVFNHVGRDFWAFRDVLEKKQASPYKDWFHISFDGNSNYNDGFWYEGWEGHFELVKLNLKNHDVRQHIFDCIRGWVEAFEIDGLRLDVAYCLNEDFVRELRSFCKTLRSDFFLFGECIHGDYRRLVNDSMLDSVTNYECYKGIYSSVNSGNMHEIAFSLHRQFGGEPWCLYRGMNLYNFVDNHDVSRIATMLSDESLLPVTYALLFAMPGIPSVYYGGELAMKGRKEDGDAALRPMVTSDDTRLMHCNLTEYIARLSIARAQSKALRRGDYCQMYVTPKQLVFSRSFEDERVICAFNTDSQPHTAHFDAGAGRALDLITGQTIDFGGGLELPPRTAYIGRIY